MSQKIHIGLVGDFRATVKAHKAIPLALAMAGEGAGCDVECEWLPTPSLAQDAAYARKFDGLWLTPASPYDSMAGALNVITLARESGIPFLGTCGGCQHILIEYARNVLHIEDADHAESNPDASVLFVTPLVCSLRDVKGPIFFEPGSRISQIYGTNETIEEYNCGFGLNPEYKSALVSSGVELTGWDIKGDMRVLELPVTRHPFFFATLYQPERSSLEGRMHPLIAAYVQAVLAALAAQNRAKELATTISNA